MQGMFGKYLENNLRTFVEFQQTVQEQSQGLLGDSTQTQTDFWTQFLNFQKPAMHNMMSAYVEQNNKMVQQMQDQLSTQARSIFTGFNFAKQKDAL
jgi:polyhydroxyalkanoate synthesis regulator protein